MAILKIDMPESCDKCQLSYIDGRDVVCAPLDKAIDDNEGQWFKKRNKLCPLQEDEIKQAELRGTEWWCPRCKNHIVMFHAGEFNNYCAFCGQKVKF